MGIISMKMHRASKEYKCEDCGGRIDRGNNYFRLFGFAHYGEKAWEVISCWYCILSSQDKNVQERIRLLALDTVEV